MLSLRAGEVSNFNVVLPPHRVDATGQKRVLVLLGLTGMTEKGNVYCRILGGKKIGQ